MNKRLLWFIPILLILGIYLFPVPQKDALALYEGTDPDPIQGLMTFRNLPTRTSTNQEVDWRYVVLGKGPKTILFLHGMTGGYDFWWQQMNLLSPNYRVISVTYPPVNNLSALGKGIMTILDQEKVDTTIVVGSSLGGYLTQYLLATYPKRISKAVLGNTFPTNTILKEKNDGKMAVARWLPTWAIMSTLRQNLLDQVIPAAENNPLAKAQLLENTYGRMSKAQFIARYDCVVDTFQPISGTQSAIPLLIMESDNDPLVPIELRTKLKQYYTSARVHTFHHKGHFPYLNAPAEYNAVLADFLQQ